MRDQCKLDWLNNAWEMEIKWLTMLDNLKLIWMRDQWKLEWINNARWMELRMTEQCARNGN